MFALNKHHSKQPIPDWQFDAEKGTTLTAPTADKLIAKLVAYRLNNGLPPGDPEHEIAMSLMLRWPHLVKEVDGTPTDNRLWAWVNRVWREAPKKITDKDTIAPRVEACKTCPFALAIPRNPELARRAYLMAAGDLQLETQCSHHRWQNGVAVLLAAPLEYARPGEPECCWLAAAQPR